MNATQCFWDSNLLLFKGKRSCRFMYHNHMIVICPIDWLESQEEDGKHLQESDVDIARKLFVESVFYGTMVLTVL